MRQSEEWVISSQLECYLIPRLFWGFSSPTPTVKGLRRFIRFSLLFEPTFLWDSATTWHKTVHTSFFNVVFSAFDAFYNGGYFRWVFWVRAFGCSQRPCVKTLSLVASKWLMPFQHAIPLNLRELELHKRRDIQPREGLAVCWWKGGKKCQRLNDCRTFSFNLPWNHRAL